MGGATVGKSMPGMAGDDTVHVRGRATWLGSEAGRAQMLAGASPGALTATVVISVCGMPPSRAKGRGGIAMESHEPFSEFLFRTDRLIASCGEREHGRMRGVLRAPADGACWVNKSGTAEGVCSGRVGSTQAGRLKGCGGANLDALSLRLVNVHWGGWRDAGDPPWQTRLQMVAQRRSPRPVPFLAPAAFRQGCDVLLYGGAKSLSLERFNLETIKLPKRLAPGLATIPSGSATTGLGAGSR